MEPTKFRNVLSWIIVSSGFAFILTIVIVSLINNQKIDEIKVISNIFLPVIAAWVGTVLAFHFGRENFDAANKNAKDLIGTMNPVDKLKNVKVSDVMTPYDKIVKYELEKDQDFKTIKLIDLLNNIKNSNFNRIHIFNKDRTIVKIIHRSIIDLAIASNAIAPEPIKTYNDLTVQDLIESPETKQYLEATLLAIRSDATLFDAKSAYDNEPNSLDVFVTQGGNIKEPVIGWITNNDILKYMK
jgi:hypothetical protein